MPRPADPARPPEPIQYVSPALVTALTMVDQGDIVSTTRSGEPVHRTTELDDATLAALLTLRRGAVLSIGPRAADGWIPWQLTKPDVPPHQKP